MVPGALSGCLYPHPYVLPPLLEKHLTSLSSGHPRGACSGPKSQVLPILPPEAVRPPFGLEWGGCVFFSLSLSLLHFVNLMMNLRYHTFPFSYTSYLLKEEVPLYW